MKVQVFDVEANGLHPDKIHCLSTLVGNYTNKDFKVFSTTEYDKMKGFLLKADNLVCHNGMRWDIPHLERLLGIKVKGRIIDTLALSWYLEPYRVRHGLEEWGEEFGVPKPPIDDWENLMTEEYIHRCEEDVKINTLLWERQWKELLNLYGSEEEALRFIDYLMFKMRCAQRQEEYGWKLDVEKVTEGIRKLSDERDMKVDQLIKAMPPVPIEAVRKPPAKPYKKNGQLSEAGKEWFNLLATMELPVDHSEPVTFIKGYEAPNPGSPEQVKAWLYSLGWKPQTFNHVKDKQTGDTRKIPQVQQDKTKGPGLCESVKALFDREPNLEALEGLSIISHRLSILKGFLDNVDDNGYVQAQIQGLTNTLRFKHKVVVNLPGVDKPYGADIRGCLVAPDGYELIGSDMSSLEDNTARHYMYDYDPEYVEEMSKDGYDPHLDLARFAGRISDEEYEFGREKPLVKAIRKNFKTANYACKYGAGGAKLALTLGIPKAEADLLVEAYWGRNWSVKEVANNTRVKVCNGGMWLFNPVSKFWYSLRHDKDKFSTLNQGTGVFCFDTYLKYIVRDLKVIGQMHDEFIALVEQGNREWVKACVNEAIRKVNEELGLNVELKVGLDFGGSYAEIH